MRERWKTAASRFQSPTIIGDPASGIFARAESPAQLDIYNEPPKLRQNDSDAFMNTDRPNEGYVPRKVVPGTTKELPTYILSATYGHQQGGIRSFPAATWGLLVWKTCVAPFIETPSCFVEKLVPLSNWYHYVNQKKEIKTSCLLVEYGLQRMLQERNFLSFGSRELC